MKNSDILNQLKIRKQLSQMFNIDIKYIDISDAWMENDINYLQTSTYKIGDEVEGHWWFRYKNKKIVIKEFLKNNCLSFTAEAGEKYIVSDIDFNTNDFYKTLTTFFKSSEFTEDIFPKFIKETKDFFIFEYIEGTKIKDLKNFEKYKKQYIDKNLQVMQNPKWRLINWFDYVWIIDNNDNLRYVNLSRFVLGNHKNRVTLEINHNTTEYIELKEKNEKVKI